MAKDDKTFENLPRNAVEYINLVIKNMRYRKKARDEVCEELIDHFEVYLKDCATNEEKEQKAQRLISEFGDPKLLAALMRRAKKRCRPLWQKILVRSFAAVLIIFVYLLICASWLRGSPTIRINYAQWLTDQQRQGRNESLNAMPEMKKATELTRKTYDWMTVNDILRIWPGDMNDDQKTVVRNFLEAHDETLNMLNKALEKPYFWTDYNSGGPIIIEANSVTGVNPVFMNNIMQPLVQYRQIAYILVARINWRAYSGDIDGTVNDLITLIRFSSHLQGQGLLVEQLVATAIETLAYNRTTMILSRVDIPAAQLKRLQDELLVSSAKNEFPIDLNGEKAFWYEHIQQGFTDDGKGNGKMLKASTLYFVGGWKDAVWNFLTFSYPDRQQALALVEKMFAEEQKNLQLTPWQKTDKPSTKLTDSAHTPFMFNSLASAFDKIAVGGWRLKTQREATLTILACLRFQKEKGTFPDNLDELVKTGYLTKLPEDPFSPSPLTYKKTADGFLLYSWGENLKDDGGQVARNEKGKTERFADTGDWVFWPVEKN
ncbi:MAG: hypothetical protein ABSB11_02480 [Sedimentisphaerales bacterium]|jgi:hypothetical protein